MFYDLLKTRRSIRKFQDKEVEREKLDLILKSALLAPSSRSIRPWEFIVVSDKELLNKLSKCREHSSQFLSGAKHAIIVIADAEKSDVCVEDASIASIVIQLAAQSQGLGSCWIQVRNRFRNKEESAGNYIKELMHIPEKYCVESIIAIGYPNENKKPYDENDSAYDKSHYDSF